MADTTFTFKFNANTKDASKGFSEMANSASSAAKRIQKAFDAIDNSIVKTTKSILAFGASIYGKALLTPLKLLKTAILGAGVAFTAVAVKSMSAANDLTDAIGVTTAAFGENAQEMHDWAKDQAVYYGLARTEAEKYFGTLGSYLKNAGVDVGTSSVMSKNVAVKSAELARSFGISNDTAFSAITKAVESGSGKALAKYGVVLSEDAYNAELLAEGINATYKELSSEEQLVIRYNTVMAQLGSVTGATSDEFMTWEGALAGLTNSAKDALASFGLILQNYLLPVIQVLTKIMQSLSASLGNLLTTLDIDTPAVTSVEDYSEAIDSLGDNIKDTGAKAKSASGGLASFDKINNLSQSGTSGGGGVASISKNIKATDKLGAAAKKNIKPFKELMDEFMNADWKAAGKKVGDWVDSVIAKLGLLGDWLKTGKLGKNLGDFLNGLTSAEVWGNTSKTLVSLLTGLLTTIGEMFSVADMMAIGSQIVTGLIDGIEENKDQIITELSNILDGISDFIIGFFDPKNMGKLGSQLGDIVNGVAENGSISKVAQALTTMIMGIFNFILEFVKTVNWLEVGTEILKGIGRAIMENPGLVIEGLGVWFVWNSVKHLFTGLTGVGQGIANSIAAPIKSAGLQGGVVALAAAGLATAVGKAIESLNSYIDSINNLYESAEKSYALLNKTDYGAVEQVAEDAQTDLFARANKAKEAEKIYESAVREWNGLAATVSERGFITNSDADAINSITDDLNRFADIAKELGMGDSGYLNEMVSNLQAITDLDLESGFWGSNLTDMQNGFANVQTAVSNAWGVTQEYNASLEEAMKRLSEKTSKDKESIDKLNESMEKMQNDELVKYIDKFSKEELKAFDDAIDTSKDKLQGFLDKVTELINLKWDGRLVDVDGLSTNLQTAVKLVKDAAKEMNDAIAQSSNLKNFEATLNSNQVIRIDSSGKIGVNVDAKAHIDSSELQSWYTEYSKTMQRDTGSKI